MSDTIIQVENLGKKYLIKHQQHGGYTALRDVIADKVKSFAKKITFQWNHKQSSTYSTTEEFWALKDISFKVNQGEVVGIIGRNGAGKSTLLKILSRITEPTEGSIRINGRVASLLEVGTGFHPELTGRENVFLNGAILGMGKAEIKRKFDEIVAFSEIEKFLDTPVKRYSSGMYIRLAFAVAAHLEPDILVIGEVLAVGDAAFQKKCLGKMRDVARKGRTVLFVSHNMGAIRQLCRTGLLLESGMLIGNGRVGSVVEKYISDLTRGSGCHWITAEDPTIPLQVLEIYSSNSKNQMCDMFDLSDRIKIVIRHRCCEEMIASVVLVSVFRNGVELLHVFDTDVHTDRLTKRLVGIYTDEIELPKRLFKAGNITISIRTGIVNKLTTFQDVNDVISFSIEEIHENTSFKGYAANRTGVLMATPVWKNIKFSVDSLDSDRNR